MTKFAQCQSKTCFRIAYFSERHATHVATFRAFAVSLHHPLRRAATKKVKRRIGYLFNHHACHVKATAGVVILSVWRVSYCTSGCFGVSSANYGYHLFTINDNINASVIQVHAKTCSKKLFLVIVYFYYKESSKS